MTDRSLEALGLATVPALSPLAYPGGQVREPSLLSDGDLLELTAVPGPLGRWKVATAGGRPCGLDDALRAMGQPVTGARHPVIAIGSNASPGQIHHKLSRLGIPAVVPIVPARVRGIGAGVSGHISPAGYVAASPYLDSGLESRLWVTWLDTEQLRAVDDTELPDYGRALLPGDEFPVVLPSGETLDCAYIYFNVLGVLADPGTGTPQRNDGDQRALLTRLLGGSARLRDLLGTTAESWVARAGADPVVRKAGTELFREEGWLLPEKDFGGYATEDRGLCVYGAPDD